MIENVSDLFLRFDDMLLIKKLGDFACEKVVAADLKKSEVEWCRWRILV